MTPEQKVTYAVRDFLVREGWRPIRHESGFVPGAGNFGEKGMPDWQFIRYLETPGPAVVLWVEMKAPNTKRRCNCRPAYKDENGKRVKAHECRSCGQKRWQDKETGRGALVVVTDDPELFKRWYKSTFSWLPPAVLGQQQQLFNEGAA